MPNYGLVIAPQYNPMSYEQYAKPFEDYGKAYNAMADSLDTLEMEANQWEKLAQNAKDRPQYEQYKRYANDLRIAANDLATNGLNMRSRGALSDMRKRYANEIKPISDAYQLRLDDIKAEDEALAKDPSLVLAQSARDRGLGEYMTGTPQRFGVSGNDVYAKTLSAFKSISGRDINLKELRRFGNTYWGLQKITGEENPAGMLEALDAIIKNPNVDPEAYKQIVEATGDPDAFYQYAQALTNVLGSTHYDKLTSEGKDKIMQSALLGGNTGMIYDIDERDYQNVYATAHAHASAATPPTAMNWDDETLVSTGEDDSAFYNSMEGTIADNGTPVLNSFLVGDGTGLFERNGKYVDPSKLGKLTAEESHAVENWNRLHADAVSQHPDGSGIPQDLQEGADPESQYKKYYAKLKELGQAYGFDVTKDSAETIRKKLSKAMDKSRGVATGKRILRLKLSSNAGNELKQQLRGSEIEMHRVKVKSDGTYEEVTGSIKPKDLEDATLQQIHYNQYLDALTVQLLVDGKKQWYTMPTEFMGASARSALTATRNKLMESNTDMSKFINLSSITKLLQENEKLGKIIDANK